MPNWVNESPVSLCERVRSCTHSWVEVCENAFLCAVVCVSVSARARVLRICVVRMFVQELSAYLVYAYMFVCVHVLVNACLEHVGMGCRHSALRH